MGAAAVPVVGRWSCGVRSPAVRAPAPRSGPPVAVVGIRDGSRGHAVGAASGPSALAAVGEAIRRGVTHRAAGHRAHDGQQRRDEIGVAPVDPIGIEAHVGTLSEARSAGSPRTRRRSAAARAYGGRPGRRNRVLGSRFYTRRSQGWSIRAGGFPNARSHDAAARAEVRRRPCMRSRSKPRGGHRPWLT